MSRWRQEREKISEGKRRVCGRDEEREVEEGRKVVIRVRFWPGRDLVLLEEEPVVLGWMVGGIQALAPAEDVGR